MNCKLLLITGLIIPLFALTECKSKNERDKNSISDISDQPGSSTPTLTVTIYQAALDGDLSQVSMHLENGLDINLPDEEGRTALMYAAYNGHTAVLKKLIEKDAAINLSDNYGRTALMMASSGPFPEAVKLLLDNNADPDMTDSEEHFTALMYAAAEGQLEVVKILLAHGADPALKDIDGDDAMTFAVKNGHKEIASLLQSFFTRQAR